MTTTATQPAGRSIAEFCKATSLSRTTFYEHARMPGRIDFVKVGSRIVILTSPADFLATFRTANQQAAS